MAFSTSSKAKAYYERLKLLGRCVTCGNDSGGLVRCKACGKRVRSRINKDKARLWQQAYHKRHPERIRNRRKRYIELPGKKERKLFLARQRRQSNPDKCRRYSRDSYAKNRDKRLAEAKVYQQRHREQYLARRRELRVVNRKKDNDRTRSWRKNNKDHVRKYASKYRANRITNDIAYAIRERLRVRIRQAVKEHSGVKATKTMTLLGCSLFDFRLYIESKFKVGMSWENWGHGNDKWNLDHIMPCAIFDLSKPEHQKRCFHFSNYQPLWQVENFRKGARHYDNQIPLI